MDEPVDVELIEPEEAEAAREYIAQLADRAVFAANGYIEIVPWLSLLIVAP